MKVDCGGYPWQRVSVKVSRKGFIEENRSKWTFRGLVGIYYLVKKLHGILRREKTGKIIEMIDIWRNANTCQSAKYTIRVWKKSLERKWGSGISQWNSSTSILWARKTTGRNSGGWGCSHLCWAVVIRLLFLPLSSLSKNCTQAGIFFSDLPL